MDFRGFFFVETLIFKHTQRGTETGKGNWFSFLFLEVLFLDESSFNQDWFLFGQGATF